MPPVVVSEAWSAKHDQPSAKVMVYERLLAECARENLRLEKGIAPIGDGVGGKN